MSRADAEAAEHVGVIVIHGVGDAEPGWINDFLVKPLSGPEGAAEGITFDPCSEVYRFEDETNRRGQAETFDVYVRNGWFGNGVKASFVELLWSDLSRVGSGELSRWFAGVRLFFEAPQVFTDAMLKGCRGRFYRLLRSFIAAINLWLRWVITGINVAAFACALALAALSSRYRDEATLIVVVTLSAVAVAGWFASRLGDDRDISLGEVWKATSVSSVLLMIAVLAAQTGVLDPVLNTRQDYLLMSSELIYGLWAVWNTSVAILVGIVAALAAKRLFVKAAPGAPALQRLAASAALIIIQGMVWKIVISAIWVFVILKVVPDEPPVGKYCGFETGSGGLAELDCRTLSISALNVMLLMEIALVTLAVVFLRRFSRWRARRAAAGVPLRNVAQPRLITNAWILATVLLGYVLNFVVYYGSQFHGSFAHTVFKFVSQSLDQIGVYDIFLWASIAGGAVFTVVSLASNVADSFGLSGKSESLAVLHIARDLVDHHFQPRLQPLRSIENRPADDVRRVYPRRARIQRRLDLVMQGIIGARGMTRLVILSHSQGTVIGYEYLRSRQGEETLQGIERLDLVTLASPLSHLYRHYFRGFEPTLASTSAVHPKLSSWINMWRIDDPIGNEVDLIGGRSIHNEALGTGGHVNYWKEARVCEVIIGLVRNPGSVGGTDMRPRVELFPALRERAGRAAVA